MIFFTLILLVGVWSAPSISKALPEESLENVSIEKSNQVKAKIDGGLKGLGSNELLVHFADNIDLAFDKIDYDVLSNGHLEAELSPINLKQPDGSQVKLSPDEFEKVASEIEDAIEGFKGSIIAQFSNGKTQGFNNVNYAVTSNNHLKADLTPIFAESPQDIEAAATGTVIFVVQDEFGEFHKLK